jgi:hypothetical protein
MQEPIDISDPVEQLIDSLEVEWGLRPGDTRVADGSVVTYEHAIQTVTSLLPIQITEESRNSACEYEASLDPQQAIADSAEDVHEQLRQYRSSCSDSTWQTTPTHQDLFESRKRRLGDFGNLWRQINTLALEREVGDGGDGDTISGVHINDDTKMRLSRMLEILYTAEQVQIGVRQLQHLLSTGIESLRNVPNANQSAEIFCKRFKREQEEAKKTPFTTFCTSMLHKLCLSGYRRYRSNVFRAVTYNGHYTYAWERVCSIEEFVWRQIDKNLHAEDFENAMANKGNIASCIDFLKNCPGFEFPDLQKDRRIHSFRNAVYITSVRDESGQHLKESHVHYFGDPVSSVLTRMTRGGQVACKFHDCVFPEDVASVSCPSLDKIMLHQQWPDEVVKWARALIGRMLHPISSIPSKVSLDNWQIIVMLLGLGNCGKSTIIDNVVYLFFDADDIVYIQNNLEKQYGWAKCKGRFMWLAPEIKADFATHTDQAQWQVIVEGGRLATGKKYAVESEQFDPFDLSGMMAGNENIEFHDNGDSVSRRRVDLYFGVAVNHVDVELPQKLFDELGSIICVCNEAYLARAREVKSRIWNYLPEYFINMRQENAAQTNALEHFLMYGNVEFGPVREGYYVHQVDFSRHFINHCREHELQNRKSLKKDYYIGPFSKRNVVMARNVHKDPNTSEKRGGNWVEGLRVVVSAAPDDYDDDGGPVST